MTLESPVETVKGVGKELAKKYRALGIKSIGDMLENYPRRYEDYSHIQPIAHIKPGTVTIKGSIKQVSGRYVRRGMHVTEAVASDDTGSVRLVWFNQPYRAAALKHDVHYYISGQFELSRQRLAIMNPSVELVSSFPVNTARIVPVYRETKGIKSSQIRRTIREVLPLVSMEKETLPAWLVQNQQFMSHAEALQTLHFPKTKEDLESARCRLGFEEVFGLSLASLLNKYELMQEKALRVPFKKQLAREFVGHLPFQLTDAQRRVVWQIYQDMEQSHPMNRLIEGDVGSGKTVVATMAALMAIEQGFQVALMAPTELLARQHADTIHNLLQPLGFANQLGLLVGGMKAAQKTQAQARIAKGEIRFIVGTHALIQEKVDMHNLGLVIIDEQHRFGVDQRKALQAKAGHMPHVLSMTATPIPRTLTLTLYGELDISVIDTLPHGRKPIMTKIYSPNARSSLYGKIDKELDEGRQMFVVCPLISESDVAPAPSAEAVYERLKTHEFKHRRVGLLHGKMKAAEKNRIMERFVAGGLDVLVATTVIEVGVDVPNATVMLIEGAERFGLAQIHQLRGRVGRGEGQGYCYLITSDSMPPSARLRALESSTNGFQLAELDLQLRGPGAIYGTLQHGQLDVRIAKLTDTDLIANARAAAQLFINKREDLLKYKRLCERVTALRSVTNLN